MNEQIKKIAIETDVWCDTNFPGDIFYDIKWEEKFALLIVKECMKLNRDILCEDDPNYLDQVYKEYFGVEQ